ncbi:MAG TPA: transaldolase, partial [Gammaproteobacteria bacterium]|nr:transaldolase [Gammaproteobacteria bacterium]
MKANPLKKLEALGQSIWLDYIKRDLIREGELVKLIDKDGLRGMTSNPSIFEKAITESKEYDQDIQKMKNQGKDVNAVFEALTQQDVRDAADAFRVVYNNSQGKDGFVSLEVNPHLADDTDGTIVEARHLWKALGRPNVMIKVPATREGLPAIKQLISEGINVNITLLFGLPRYQAVIEAYLSGLELRLAMGKPLKSIASVASFFLSRIDVLVDPLLEKMIAEGNELSILAKEMHGQVAIASAKAAYQIYKQVVASDRFKKLAEKGGEPQRLLWASTGTKNPTYSDIQYIEALIGPETVNTIPVETLDAYRDHGDPKLLLEKDVEKAKWIFQKLPELGINIDQVTQQLEQEGVKKF